MPRLILTPVTASTKVDDTPGGGLVIENALIAGDIAGHEGPVTFSEDLADDVKVASGWFTADTIEVDADWNETFSCWEATAVYRNGAPIRIGIAA